MSIADAQEATEKNRQYVEETMETLIELMKTRTMEEPVSREPMNAFFLEETAR